MIIHVPQGKLTANINPHEHGFVSKMQTLIPANINEFTVHVHVYLVKAFNMCLRFLERDRAFSGMSMVKLLRVASLGTECCEPGQGTLAD